MRIFFNIIGWVVGSLGAILAGIFLIALCYATLVPDTSGSPDARGMAAGLSILGLVAGVLMLAAGSLVVSLSKKRET
jgi:hypothetical protein